jgi:hypothetical protein
MRPMKALVLVFVLQFQVQAFAGGGIFNPFEVARLGKELAMRGLRGTSSLTCQILAEIPSHLPLNPNAAAFAQTQIDYFHGGPLEVLKDVDGVYPAMWVLIRESLVAGQVPRALKEILSVQVSALNKCPFCTGAHGTVSRFIPGVDPNVVGLVENGKLDEIKDPDLKRLAYWVRGLHDKNFSEHQNILSDMPQALRVELRSLVLTVNVANRIVDLFPPEEIHVDEGSAMSKAIEMYVKASFGIERKPGLSLGLLDEAPAFSDLSWSAANADVYAAVNRARWSIEKAAARHIPEAVRRFVFEQIHQWDGQSKIAVSKLKASHLVQTEGLSEADALTAEFLLRTAFASYTLAERDQPIWEKMSAQYTVPVLKTMAAWAAFHGANRVASQ